MYFGNYFVIISIVLTIGQVSLVAGGVDGPDETRDETYEYFRAGFDREGFHDSLSDEEAVKLRLMKSEDGVVVPEDLFYEDEGAGRARRNVDQTQRDEIVQTLNDIRRSVNSSDIQYMVRPAFF